MAVPPSQPADRDSTPLWSVLSVTFFASLGTGVFWNAISFIAKHAYGFEQERTLVLYLVMGATYTVGAAMAGRITRACARWMWPRTLLVVVILVQVALCLLPVLASGEWALWCAVFGVSFASSIIWPVTESYLTAGRHGKAMRSSIGYFNLTWMFAVAVPLLLMPPIIEHHAQWAVGAQAFVNLVALLPLRWFARAPGHHDEAQAEANVTPEYALLLRSARVLLPLSYVLNAALSPILPYRFEAIGADIMLETPVTATWMLVRLVACAVMWRVGFWHGRWGTLLLAAAAMTGGFGLVVLAENLAIMLAGFAIFGIGMGGVYYAALYYAMAVGRAEVDAGGTHEALIGFGYTVGPIAGLAGTALGGGAAIVGIVWGLVGVGALGAARPYLAARRLRRRA
ncbi:MAG: MFS transporter [Planctomycetes bacterium]|nr:MFS transporter [Planctomycetota bacterium]